MADIQQSSDAKARLARKIRTGVVTSDKMDKTVVVTIERRVPRPSTGR